MQHLRMIVCRKHPGYIMVEAEWNNLPQPGEAKVDPEVNKIVSCFLQHFSPADDFTDADYTPGTIEIFLQVQKLYPNEAMTAKQVYNAMQENGFKYDLMPGTSNFYWLMKRR